MAAEGNRMHILDSWARSQRAVFEPETVKRGRGRKRKAGAGAGAAWMRTTYTGYHVNPFPRQSWHHTGAPFTDRKAMVHLSPVVQIRVATEVLWREFLGSVSSPPVAQLTPFALSPTLALTPAAAASPVVLQSVAITRLPEPARLHIIGSFERMRQVVFDGPKPSYGPPALPYVAPAPVKAAAEAKPVARAKAQRHKLSTVRVPDETRAAVRRTIAGGETNLSKVARAHGVSRTTIANILKQKQLEPA